MSVWLHSFKEYANVLRFITGLDRSDDLYFTCMDLASRYVDIGGATFGPEIYERAVMDPRFPILAASEDAIGLGKVWVANVRAYNAFLANMRTPRQGEPEQSADYAARRIVIEALLQGTSVNAHDAVQTVQLMRYNTEFDADFAATVEGADKCLNDVMARAFGVLADMWRHGDKVPR